MTTSLAVESPTEEPTAPAPPDTYRPHLDGLRAVAVYLVLLFHAGLNSFSGGYIGVDVFFVLSGYLVTQLLLRDLAHNGSIRFGRFYARRFRRLLPAAFVALIVTAVVFTAISSTVEVSGAMQSFKAAFLYSANWYFIHHASGYFGADISTNPVLPFWSLAVEEQFYLLWPLTLGGIFLLSRRLDPRRQMGAIKIAVAVGAVGSAAWALSLRTGNPNHAYYGTDTRAYELLAGALLALTPTSIDWAKRFARSMLIATFAGIGALLVLSSSWFDLDAIQRGVAVTITTCVLIVAIEAAAGGWVKRILSSSTAVYLGKVSYGTYLWHWLVILVVLRTFQPGPVATVGITCLVATALASLSFQILERPVRTSALLDRHRRIVIASGLVISVVSGLVFIPRIVDPAHASTKSRETSEHPVLTPVPTNLVLQGETAPYTHCYNAPVTQCTVVTGPGKHILLMGDSHAWMLVPLFTQIAREQGLTLSVSVAGACPWQQDLYTPFETPYCKAMKADLYQRVIPALHPDLIVAVNLGGYSQPGNYFPFDDANGARASFATVESTTKSSVAALRAGGSSVLLVEPVPIPKAPSPFFDPYKCLQKSKVQEECRYTADASPSAVDLLYRDVAKQTTGVYSLDLDRQVCPLLPICDPVIGGQIVKLDPSHLTADFSVTLAPYVETYMKSVGLLTR
jgi:peptidoglycan/LPS O-acetylase OafA/YrhL